MTEILVAAIVAALVTLAIEYGAKPRLEARKEQIVGRVRVRHEAIDALRRIHANFGMMRDVRQIKTGKQEERDLLQSEVARFRRQNQKHYADLLRASEFLYDKRDPLVYQTLTSTAGILLVASNQHTAAAVPDEEFTLAVAFSLGMLTSSRHSRKGRDLRREAREWVTERTAKRGARIARSPEVKVP